MHTLVFHNHPTFCYITNNVPTNDAGTETLSPVSSVVSKSCIGVISRFGPKMFAQRSRQNNRVYPCTYRWRECEILLFSVQFSRFLRHASRKFIKNIKFDRLTIRSTLEMLCMRWRFETYPGDVRNVSNILNRSGT